MRLPIQQAQNSRSEPHNELTQPVVITVVAAVIEQNDRFFLTRRHAGAHLEGLWEFPGGKVDPGESHPDALRREIREELDADVDVRDLLFEITHEYPDRIVALYFYKCALNGEPRALLGQEMRWVARGELSSLGFPPADEELITLLSESSGFRLQPEDLPPKGGSHR
jgi:mutator protein MutT